MIVRIALIAALLAGAVVTLAGPIYPPADFINHFRPLILATACALLAAALALRGPGTLCAAAALAGLNVILLLLPLVATPVAVGIVFNLFYDPTIGLANFVLTSFGLPPGLWVSNARTVIASLVLVDVWQWTPMITLIVLAGLAGLSEEPVEAARIDGASEWQIIRWVTIPMVMPVILTALILRLIDALKTFDIIYAMTGGGPGYSSETLNIMGFKYSFEYFRMGQSAVILVVLFLVVFGCSLGIMKLRAWSEK